MRILSQDGMVDLPYESIGIFINYHNKTDIIAYPTGSYSPDDEYWRLAHYSTEDKARKAMEMLQKAYSPLLIIKDLGDGIEADIKPNDWKINRTEPTGIRENYYFRFPTDDEIEV